MSVMRISTMTPTLLISHRRAMPFILVIFPVVKALPSSLSKWIRSSRMRAQASHL